MRVGSPNQQKHSLAVEPPFCEQFLGKIFQTKISETTLRILGPSNARVNEPVLREGVGGRHF